MTTLIDAYHFAALAVNLMILDCEIIIFCYSLFMAAYHMAVPDFFVFPQLFLAGCTMYREHMSPAV